MAKNLADNMKDILGGVIHGKGVMVAEETYHRRMSICNSCEFFRQEDKRCTQCGCFMEAKTRFKKTYCPVHKWEVE
jgi:formamidopyrimidine-DNA glycosylase